MYSALLNQGVPSGCVFLKGRTTAFPGAAGLKTAFGGWRRSRHGLTAIAKERRERGNVIDAADVILDERVDRGERDSGGRKKCYQDPEAAL